MVQGCGLRILQSRGCRFREERLKRLDELGCARSVDDMLGNATSLKPAGGTAGVRPTL